MKKLSHILFFLLYTCFLSFSQTTNSFLRYFRISGSETKNELVTLLLNDHYQVQIDDDDVIGKKDISFIGLRNLSEIRFSYLGNERYTKITLQSNCYKSKNIFYEDLINLASFTNSKIFGPIKNDSYNSYILSSNLYEIEVSCLEKNYAYQTRIIIKSKNIYFDNSIFNKTILRILAYGDESNFEGQNFIRIVKSFMELNPDIYVDYELLYDEAYHQKAVARLAAGDVPDVAYMGADSRWGAEWQEANQQVDNTPYFPSNIDATLIPDFFGTGVKPYLPLGGSNFCTVVAVNMELLNKIGGKLPETYADMKELAKLCKANGIELMSTHGADGWVWGSCVMSGIIPRTTGDTKWIEKAVNKEVKFTDAGFVAALDVLSQWVKDGVLDPKSVLTDNGTGMSNFVNGKYLMYIDGQWAFSESNLGTLSKTVKLISIPEVPGETACHGSLAGAWQVGYGITKKGASDPKVLDAAKRFMAYFYSEAETVQRLRDGDISAPILKNFVLPEGMDPCIAEKATLGAYESCYVIDSYLTGVANDILNAGMRNIVAGNIDAKTLAANVQKAFDAQ